ncbi:MAG: GTPase domain-containing protein [Deltaproteobacteria bacterium]|nr:GTPase domain-containing protein [Deltaproteobacteria bacterium]
MGRLSLLSPRASVSYSSAMPFLDTERQCVVIRVIYDGPALAGKTTNLRYLASTLGSELFSGEDVDGRTLYFDWVDYVGGSFQGMPIRCQIIGVPGQRVLERRRRLLLETADAVVFVADSRPEALEENLRSFVSLQEITGQRVPPVGVVLQANKRDCADAATVEELREALGCAPTLATTEAISETGEGVRETFVLAARLALERVRELWSRNALPKLSSTVDSGPALLAATKEAEKNHLPSLSTLGLGGRERRSPLDAILQQRGSQEPTRATDLPLLPDSSIPVGGVWPPVEGRAMLHESARAKPTLEQVRGGDWVGLSPSWKLRSPVAGLFKDPKEASLAIIDWARWHAKAGPRLLGQRCLALVDDGAEGWRLWQVVPRLPTLLERAQRLFAQPNDVHLGEGLFEVIDLRLRAETKLVGSGLLGRLDLDSVAVSENSEPIFAGFSPFPARLSTQDNATSIDEDRLVRDELGPLLQSQLHEAPHRIPGLLASFQEVAAKRDRQGLARVIRQVLLVS